MRKHWNGLRSIGVLCCLLLLLPLGTLYANGSDIVTCVPPVLFGFRHVSKLTRIGDRFNIIGLFRPNKYHHIDGYIESLQKETLHG